MNIQKANTVYRDSGLNNPVIKGARSQQGAEPIPGHESSNDARTREATFQRKGKTMKKRKYLFPKNIRRIMSERTRAALAERLRQGKRIGACPLFGYTYQGDQMIEHPGEQAIAKQMIKLRKQGLSLRGIGRMLEAKGIFPPRGHKHWTHTTIRLVCRRAGVK